MCACARAWTMDELLTKLSKNEKDTHISFYQMYSPKLHENILKNYNFLQTGPTKGIKPEALNVGKYFYKWKFLRSYIYVYI